ncbi:MAG: hypothetical protein U9R58_03605 [Chloroflexota bacterium]|nr:hypothetical protein [Chloroflexota bacterium]
MDRDANRLIAEIEAYGLRLLVGGQSNFNADRMSADELIASLVQHPDARLHVGLMSLLLYRPSLVMYMNRALERLAGDYCVKLKLYYTASAFLSNKYSQQLHSMIANWKILPDTYSRELGVQPSGDADENLRSLAKRHFELTNYCANWLGTYDNVARRLITRLERESQWAI